MYKTNIDRLDSSIGGLNNGELITIGGRPASGKTTTVIDIMNNISEQVDNKILYFALDINNFFKAKINSDKIEIIENINSINDIKIKCEEVSTNGLSLVVVDYIQLVNAEDGSSILKALKQLALELSVPIIVITELGTNFKFSIDIFNNSDKIVSISKNDDIEYNVIKNI